MAKRVRKLTGNTTTGRPGFKGGGSMARGPGAFVSKTKAAKGSVRRLIARNPADGISANIGTKRDIGRFTNNSKIPNVNSASSPRIVKQPNFTKGNRVASGQKRIVKKINSAVRRLK